MSTIDTRSFDLDRACHRPRAGRWLLARSSLRMMIVSVVMLASGCSRQMPVGFPDQAGGWSRQGEARTFIADNLYEYLDGGADRYVKAGVKQVLTADYRFQGKTDAVADVFVMGSAEGAKTASQYYRDARCIPAQIGDEGSCLFPGSLEFRKGIYLVHLVVYPAGSGPGPNNEDVLELGKALAAKLR